jgi:subtilisin family serine protease
MRYINLDKNSKKSIDSLSAPYAYKISDYGIVDNNYGKGVKILIIDSGCPRHKDIEVRGDKTNFCDHTDNIYDSNGHCTMVSGVIAGNSKDGIMGLSPLSTIHYAKIIDNFNDCIFNDLVSAVLWGIVKEVDIILISLGTQYDYGALKDVIKKAHDSNICIIAAAGNDPKTIDVDFPARYPEVLSVDCSIAGKKIKKRKVDLWLPNKRNLTTYLDDKYVRVGGSSMAAAKVAGIASILVGKKAGKKKIYDFHLKLRKSLEKLL